jgi:hypothetical protein
MISALVYLEYHTFRNRVVRRLMRLRQPKYLVGAIVGALYFYFYFFRSLFGVPGRARGMPLRLSPSNQSLYEALGATMLFMVLLLAWVVPRQRAALAFTEAEVAFLFPAPISRRGLIHFKLLRSQGGILFATFILMLVTHRFGGRFWIHATGWWLILTTLNLHLLGSSFARTLLLDRGIGNWQRRVAILLLGLLLCAAVVVWARRTLPPLQLSQFENLSGLKDYFELLISSGPIPWILFPFRIIVRPYLAPDPFAFLSSLPAALVLLGLHYYWVIRSDVSFEEASVEASRKLAEKMADLRAGKLQSTSRKVKARRPPFKLRPTGPPATALLWKNLISAGRAFTLRAWLALGAVGITLCFWLGQSSAGADLGSALGMAAAMLVLWTFLLGPQMFRQDFRQDLPLADVLKSYPLRGWQIALGELLAPSVILTGVQWFLLLAAACLCSQTPFSTIHRSTILAACLAAALIVPTLNCLILQIPNAAVLLFPAWVQPGKGAAQGIEATGQRIIFMLGQLLLFLVVIIPATLGFGLGFFLAKLVLGPTLAIPLAAAVSALVLSAEAAVGLVLLGSLFDRLDLSAERLA